MTTQHSHDFFYVKILFACFFASLASLATFPYGFRFIYNCGFQEGLITFFLGMIFAFSATLANSILGTYSLIKIENQEWLSNHFIVGFLSLLGSIPVGFICFFGYETILPLTLNILLSLIVVIVNSAIGFTAMRNVIAKRKSLFSFFKIFFSNKSNKKILNKENIYSIFGIFIGILVSLIGYLATVHGINNLLSDTAYHWRTPISYGLALFAWIPSAALYANANFTVVKELYLKMRVDSEDPIQTLTPLNLFVLVIFLFSGTAFAEITYETLRYTFHELNFFMGGFLKYFQYYLLIPLALLSSAAVNYFAMKKLFMEKKSITSGSRA